MKCNKEEPLLSGEILIRGTAALLCHTEMLCLI